MLEQYYTQDRPDLVLSQPGVLAVIDFSEQCYAPDLLGTIPIGLESLTGQRFEVIKVGNSKATEGTSDGCQWRYNDQALSIATWLSPDECLQIEQPVTRAYKKLFEKSRALGFPHALRMWNFIPRINHGAGDHEAYKRFCIGRQSAFDQLGLSKCDYPAASALGHHTEGAVIHMICAASPGVHHENPRQEPAYRYPRQYGPCSPSFARATSLQNQNEQQILISGTASILGHDTQAAGDLYQQLGITVENIQWLQNNINREAGHYSALRVYLRHPKDLAFVQDWLQEHLPDVSTTVLHADICRSNLLVEIECSANTQISVHAKA